MNTSQTLYAHGLIRHANMLMSMNKCDLVANTINVDRFHASTTHWLETIIIFHTEI